MGNKYYIYEWFIKETQEVFYVGKGCGNRYKTRKRENEYFVKMLNSHNCEVRKVKSDLFENEAFEEEIKLIAYYRNNTNYRLTNILDGGNQPPTFCGEDSPSKREEVRIKIGKANKRVWASDGHKDKMSKILKDYYKTESGKKNCIKKYNNCLGLPIMRAIVAEKVKATMQTDEFKQKHSKIMKKAYESEEVRNKVSGANNGASRRIGQYDLNGNLIGEYETLVKANEITGLNYKNISKALNGHNKTAYGYVWKFLDNKQIIYSKRKPYGNDIIRKRKPIFQYDMNYNFIKEFESVTAASEELNINRVNIIKNLKGTTKSAYGFKWRYKD